MREIILEIKKVILDKHRKPVVRILYELLHYLIKNRDLLKYYSKNILHRKDVKTYLDYYIGKKEFYKIRPLVKDIELILFFEDKVLFQHHFKESNIRLAKYLGFNIGKNYFSLNGNKSIADADSFSRLIEDLRVRTSASSIFIKPISGFGGRDCFRIDVAMLNSDHLAKVYNKVSSAKYLF